MRRAYQSKGGKVRTAKGFAKMSADKHLKASSLGGKNKHENSSRKGAIQTQESAGNGAPRMEDLLNILEDKDELQE